MSFTKSAHKRNQVFSPHGKKSLTQQSAKDECDIHTIMRKAKKTGIVSHVNKYQGKYMDCASRQDFLQAQVILANAKSLWETVPSHIRSDFHNDYGEFIEFMQDPENRDQIREYGLDTSHLPLPKITPEPVEVVIRENKSDQSQTSEASAEVSSAKTKK